MSYISFYELFLMTHIHIIKHIKFLLLLTFGFLVQSVSANENLENLLKKGQCLECDLTKVNLGFKDITRSILKKSNLTKAYLVSVDLSGGNLTGATLTGAYMNGAILRDANLEGADFTDAELELADFTAANLKNVDFSGAYLLHAIITEYQFGATRLCKTVMPNASINNRDCSQ
tara:strand:+ start:689 stop:1210 length:522 start_codon:yes stop_codon:yes gene_type:complete